MAVSVRTMDRLLGWLLILLALCVFVFGLMTSVSLGWTRRILNGGCLLAGSVRVSWHRGNSTVRLTDSDTAVGGTACSYCVFANVAVIIYAIVWFWFYVFLCRRDCATRRWVYAVRSRFPC
ncbi:hypothetical protein LSAT2_014692 [Lamellibrachia satsuma]|nr:hypothetical protein LSAT2_014692 [Lamellibrachia satsuma]